VVQPDAVLQQWGQLCCCLRLQLLLPLLPLLVWALRTHTLLRSGSLLLLLLLLLADGRSIKDDRCIQRAAVGPDQLQHLLLRGHQQEALLQHRLPAFGGAAALAWHLQGASAAGGGAVSMPCTGQLQAVRLPACLPWRTVLLAPCWAALCSGCTIVTGRLAVMSPSEHGASEPLLLYRTAACAAHEVTALQRCRPPCTPLAHHLPGTGRRSW
jgi:hypothetical protein